MASGFVIRKNQYYDSVFLMTVNRRISEVPGVQQTAVLMGSPANKQLLLDIGIQAAQIEAAQPNDLIVAAIADTAGIVENVLGRLDEWLNAVQESAPTSRKMPHAGRRFGHATSYEPGGHFSAGRVRGTRSPQGAGGRAACVPVQR